MALDSMQTDDTPAANTEAKPNDQRAALVRRVHNEVKADKKHYEDVFKEMIANRYAVTHGCDEEWAKDKNAYKANITGRHIKRKTAALYAKNPRVVAKEPEYMHFAVWDETAASLEQAMATLAAVADPMALAALPGAQQMAAQIAAQEAQAVIADFQQGMAMKAQLKKIAKTMEILFTRAMRDQQPVDFKSAAKMAVRRALTTKVAYCELAIQRQNGKPPLVTNRLTDEQGRLDHLQRLIEQVADPQERAKVAAEMDAEIEQLRLSIQDLQGKPEIVLREGLIFDWPESHKVIPHRKMKQIVGFIGCEHITIEYDFTVDQIKERFGKDVSVTSTKTDDEKKATEDSYGKVRKGCDIVQVWKHYHKPSGMMYLVADGYPDFLEEPRAPDVFVDEFWPVYVLTFNGGELEEGKPYPKSDVESMASMQREHNRSREGQRDHRKAAQPRWVYGQGSFKDEATIELLKRAQPFSMTELNLPPGRKIDDVFQSIPVPGVDPNLYEVGPYWDDTQIVVGSAEARFGGLSKATATEAAISEGSTSAVDACDIDDLDSFLTALAKAGGQILLKEMSAEYVMRTVGPGAVWPDASLSEIARHVYLEVAAGSTGRPNQAVEVANWSKMVPYLIQMPKVNEEWLVKETVTRLDDKLDYVEALNTSALSIAAQNMLAGKGGVEQPSEKTKTGREPGSQGAKGQDNTPKSQGQSGSDAPMGSNQV